MHWKRMTVHTASLAIMGLGVLGIMVGCNQPAKDETSSKAGNDASAQADEGKSHPRSIFAGTPMEFQPPICLTMNRTCTEVAFKVNNPRTNEINIRGVLLTDGKVEATREYVRDDSLIQDPLTLHPVNAECLAASIKQLNIDVVADVVWRLRTANQWEVPYLEADGMRQDWSADDYYRLEPYYSWDGRTILVPLKTEGIVVIDQMSDVNTFIPYPDFEGWQTGIASGPIPDKDGHRRVFVSLWEAANGPDEHSAISILDLDTLEWERTTNVAWPVYQVAADDLDVDPWLITGSRQPIEAEVLRVHLLAYLDPDTEALKLLPLKGEPVWRSVVLDPRGGTVAYMGTVRKGIVRLDLVADTIEVDTGYYSEDAKLFINEGGDKVYAWDGPDLIAADFSMAEELDN